VSPSPHRVGAVAVCDGPLLELPTKVVMAAGERGWWLSVYPEAREAGGGWVSGRTGGGRLDERDVEERSAVEAARRARGQVRRYCAGNRLNRLGTLTYRGEGCHDPKAIRQDLGVFFRKLRRGLGGEPFPYLWVPEWHPQGHGLHAHQPRPHLHVDHTPRRTAPLPATTRPTRSLTRPNVRSEHQQSDDRIRSGDAEASRCSQVERDRTEEPTDAPDAAHAPSGASARLEPRPLRGPRRVAVARGPWPVVCGPWLLAEDKSQRRCPRRRASATAPVRDVTSSLANRLDRCDFTVAWLMKSIRAMVALS